MDVSHRVWLHVNLDTKHVEVSWISVWQVEQIRNRGPLLNSAFSELCAVLLFSRVTDQIREWRVFSWHVDVDPEYFTSLRFQENFLPGIRACISTYSFTPRGVANKYIDEFCIWFIFCTTLACDKRLAIKSTLLPQSHITGKITVGHTLSIITSLHMAKPKKYEGVHYWPCIVNRWGTPALSFSLTTIRTLQTLSHENLQLIPNRYHQTGPLKIEEQMRIGSGRRLPKFRSRERKMNAIQRRTDFAGRKPNALERRTDLNNRNWGAKLEI